MQENVVGSNPVSRVSRVSAVVATWCPHCHPISVDNSKILAERLGASVRILDIDDAESVKVADDLVKKYGDDSEDYLIPQIFLEFQDGTVKHILTGFSENPEITRRHWNDLFQSKFVEELIQKR
jgi:thiol-disulfide isomerase/thioredoxin